MGIAQERYPGHDHDALLHKGADQLLGADGFHKGFRRDGILGDRGDQAVDATVLLLGGGGGVDINHHAGLDFLAHLNGKEQGCLQGGVQRTQGDHGRARRHVIAPLHAHFHHHAVIRAAHLGKQFQLLLHVFQFQLQFGLPFAALQLVLLGLAGQIELGGLDFGDLELAVVDFGQDGLHVFAGVLQLLGGDVPLVHFVQALDVLFQETENTR